MVKKKENKLEEVSLEAQERLVEILTDSPRLISLAGTEWEIKALRMGSQYLIAREVIKINKANSATFGDIIQQFAVNIPAVIDVLTIALLNDKKKIFKDGIEGGEYSDLFKATRDTLMWECNVSEFGNLLFEVLQMVQIDFFQSSLTVINLLREQITMRKTPTPAQK